MNVQRCIVDNRTFLLGLDQLYRTAMKEHERGELLGCAKRLAAALDVAPADVPIEGYYGEDEDLTRYFRLMRALQGVPDTAREAVAGRAEFRRLQAVTAAPLYGRAQDVGKLLPVGRDPLSQALDNTKPGWSAADQDCHAKYPDPAATMRGLVRRLNEHPLQVEISDPRNGAPLRFPLTGWMVGDFVLHSIAFDDAGYIVPYLSAMAEGSDELARTTADYLAAYYADLDGFSDGVNASSECSEEYAFNDQGLIDTNLRVSAEFEGAEGADWMRIVCGVWPVETKGPTENQAVVSDTPTLLLVGEFDPITPPDWTWAVHANLPNSYLFEFRRIGHDVLSGSYCAPLILSDFLKDPARKPPTICLSREIKRSSGD